MPVITVKKDPAGIKPVDIHNVSGSVILRDFLLEHFEPDFGGLHALIWINGREYISTATMSAERCETLLDVELGFFDNVRIELRPAGVDPFTAAIIVAVAVGAAALTLALAPRPRLPQLPGDEARTSSNQLNASRNGFRNRQAIADIGGECIVYPDFIQPPYYFYQNNERVFREIFCVGAGPHALDLVKDGDTRVDDILQSDYTVLPPGQSPSDLLNVRTVQSSVDLDLLSPDTQTKTGYIEAFMDAQVLEPDTIVLPVGFISALEIGAGSTIDFDISYLDGANNVISVSGTGVDVISASGAFLQIDYPFTIDGRIISGYITNTAFVFDPPWFVLEGDQISEVWFNLVMPQGIRKGDGTNAQVSAVLEVQALDVNGDPVGSPIQRGALFSGNTQSPLRQTFRLTGDDGITAGRYRARASRVTASLGDNALDLLTLEGISSVTPYTGNFGNVTLLDVTRRSNQRVNRGSSDRINCRAQRLLQVYNPMTGTVGGSYVATRRFADYVIYLLHTLSGVPLTNIALDELFGIQDSLPEELGRFDGVFDDRNMSLRDRLRIVCNAARVNYWNEGLNWHFVRDEAKPFRALSFGRRNLKGGQQRYVQKFRRPADYDSVSVQWVDPVKNVERTVDRRILPDGSIANGLGARPLTFDMRIGVRTEAQAVNRAELEIRRLIYQGIEVQDTALNDALLTQVGQRVDYVDIYDTDLFDGELLSVSGNVYTTSERFEPKPGAEYWVYVTDANGTPSNSVRAYPRTDGNIFGFEASGLSGAYMAGGVVQSGSRYFIATDSDIEASAFIVMERGRPNQLGECSIKLAEYNPSMYEAD